MNALNPWKLYRQGSRASACFSLSLWGIILMIAMIVYLAITGDDSIAPIFYATGLLALLPTLTVTVTTIARKSHEDLHR
tara:strand:+ start:706 stop:942 length:237 start_codon:yes stop_codon:yes gene_type:complete